MGDVVNLKRFKKRSEREQAAKQADANRARLAEPSPNARGMNWAQAAPTSFWTNIASTVRTHHEITGR